MIVFYHYSVRGDGTRSIVGLSCHCFARGDVVLVLVLVRVHVAQWCRSRADAGGDGSAS